MGLRRGVTVHGRVGETCGQSGSMSRLPNVNVVADRDSDFLAALEALKSF